MLLILNIHLCTAEKFKLLNVGDINNKYYFNMFRTCTRCSNLQYYNWYGNFVTTVYVHLHMLRLNKYNSIFILMSSYFIYKNENIIYLNI